jgi:hypothetical protein
MLKDYLKIYNENDKLTSRKWTIWKGDPFIVFHETSKSAEEKILKEGFKTGKELNTGETTNAIFTSQVFENSYVRNSNKGIRIPINIKGLKLMNVDEIPIDNSKKSFEQESYIIRCNAEDGIFPNGYDGIISYHKHGKYKNKIWECVLKPEVAIKRIIKE